MAASGKPVMCAIIFAVKDLDPTWVMGLDPFCPWAVHDDDIEKNMGRGKQYPLGPECEFEGKQIPTFCCCSENGSITSELFKKMLKNIDKLEAFDRSNGTPLFLLLDGHGSRFQLDVLEYVNDVRDEGHKWNVCWSTLWDIILASRQQCRAKWFVQNCIVMGKDGYTGKEISGMTTICN